MSAPTEQQAVIAAAREVVDAAQLGIRVVLPQYENEVVETPLISEIDHNLYQGACVAGVVLPEFFAHVVCCSPGLTWAVDHQLRSFMAVCLFDDPKQDCAAVPAMARWVNACRESGPVLVHCQGGLNRSSLVTAAALIAAGMRPARAIARVRERRHARCLFNAGFERWLLRYDWAPSAGWLA